MTGRISQSFIDDLLNRVDIVETVDKRVKLKKTGKNYSACCPFHDEKTPSFTVSPDKQFYYCFGCGAGGNAIGFVMEFDRLNFPEAVENLAKAQGLEIQREEPLPGERDNRQFTPNKQGNSLYDLLEKCSKFYRYQLKHHPQSAEAIDYLKSRGLSGEIAQRFGIGFAPPGWDNLLSTLGDTDKKREQLETTGMAIRKEDSNRMYDRFRHRIMFPIRDQRGRTIAFGGRVLGDDKPKYLNSPETPVFHKGRELYGLWEARQALRDIPRLLLVEGYMDVVALAQHGIHNAVATLGTAATSDHLVRIFRQTSEAIFCFDGDNAGRTAARRALENALPIMEDGRQAKFLFLPDGEDPDTLVRQIGAEAFDQKIDKAISLSEFLLTSSAEGLDLESPEGKSTLAKRALPLINKLPRGTFKELLFKELGLRTGLNQETLKDLTQDLPQPTPSFTATPSPAAIATSAVSPSRAPLRAALNSSSRTLTTHQKLIGLLLNNPDYASQLSGLPLISGQDPEQDLLLEILTLLQEQPNLLLGTLLGLWHDRHGQDSSEELARLAFMESHDMISKPEAEFRGCLDLIRHQLQQQELDDLIQRADELTPEEKQYMKHLIAARRN
ncbi:MAG: DNA primase [Cellvibrionaceae bacterium]